jgi:hypothetical protein
LAAEWIYLASAYGTLPETIATHFDAGGKPDGHGPRILLWIIPGVHVAFLAALAFLARRPDPKVAVSRIFRAAREE